MLGFFGRQARFLGRQLSSASQRLPKILPRMVTDIILDPPNAGRRVVIDAKFTSIIASGYFRDASLDSGYLHRTMPTCDRRRGATRDGTRRQACFSTRRMELRSTSTSLSRTTPSVSRRSTSAARPRSFGTSCGAFYESTPMQIQGATIRMRMLRGRLTKGRSPTEVRLPAAARFSPAGRSWLREHSLGTTLELAGGNEGCRRGTSD
jgi:hypothetical protein